MNYFDALNHVPWFGYTFAIFIGASIGSFLTVVVERLPLMILNETENTLAQPRSHCPICKNNLKWYQNIPLISYLALRGKCGFCSTPIPCRYWLLEVITTSVAVLCMSEYGASLNGLITFIAAAVLIALAIIDLKHKLLPDLLTYTLLWAGLVWSTLNGPVAPAEAIYAAMSGYLFLYVLRHLSLIIKGVEGLGLGDAKLLAAAGTFVGFMGLPLVIFIGSIITLIMGLVYRRKTGSKEIPFGPGLIIATVFVFLMTPEGLLGLF